jgi:hypothetical protein
MLGLPGEDRDGADILRAVFFSGSIFLLATMVTSPIE